MILKALTEKQKKEYNNLVTHIIQSWEWGQFRQELGTPVLRFGLYHNNKLTIAFQITLHKIPFTKSFVGYLPKGPLPDQNLAEALQKIGQDYHCAFIKTEPNVLASKKQNIDPKFTLSSKPLFTKHNFILDLSQSETTTLQNMHPKTRYNIKVAQKHGVIVENRTDTEAFEIYQQLYFDTTKRQGYLGHTPYYHRKVWETLQKNNLGHILIAFYTPPETREKIPLNAWMLIHFKDTLYYPYGGSSTEYKNVMAPVLTAWEAIKLGKRLGLKKFDLWGALGPNASPNHPYQGFNTFKKNLGGSLVEYLPTYDLVFNKPLYYLFTLIDKLMPLKLLLLKLIKKS